MLQQPAAALLLLLLLLAAQVYQQLGFSTPVGVGGGQHPRPTPTPPPHRASGVRQRTHPPRDRTPRTSHDQSRATVAPTTKPSCPNSTKLPTFNLPLDFPIYPQPPPPGPTHPKPSSLAARPLLLLPAQRRADPLLYRGHEQRERARHEVPLVLVSGRGRRSVGMQGQDWAETAAWPPVQAPLAVGAAAHGQYSPPPVPQRTCAAQRPGHPPPPAAPTRAGRGRPWSRTAAARPGRGELSWRPQPPANDAPSTLPSPPSAPGTPTCTGCGRWAPGSCLHDEAAVAPDGLPLPGPVEVARVRLVAVTLVGGVGRHQHQTCGAAAGQRGERLGDSSGQARGWAGRAARPAGPRKPGVRRRGGLHAAPEAGGPDTACRAPRVLCAARAAPLLSGPAARPAGQQLRAGAAARRCTQRRAWPGGLIS
jgi:hypothetical protein